MTDDCGISGKIALRWLPLDLTDDKSKLVQVMTWCRQATSHYLSQCWPRSMSPYSVIRPKWVNKYILLIFPFCLLLHWSHECSSGDQTSKCLINPLRAKFFRGNINIYSHFVSFLHIDMTQVVEILPQVRQEPTYSTQSISWLLMSWRRKEPGHQ